MKFVIAGVEFEVLGEINEKDLEELNRLSEKYTNMFLSVHEEKAKNFVDKIKNEIKKFGYDKLGLTPIQIYVLYKFYKDDSERVEEIFKRNKCFVRAEYFLLNRRAEFDYRGE